MTGMNNHRFKNKRKNYEIFYHFCFCILGLFMDFKKRLKEQTNNSRYQISKVTGISEQTLSNYLKGRTDVGNMSYNNAIKLTQYAKENNL